MQPHPVAHSLNRSLAELLNFYGHGCFSEGPSTRLTWAKEGTGESKLEDAWRLAFDLGGAGPAAARPAQGRHAFGTGTNS